nr:phosphoribosylglycinamide synthetase [Bifidobacterium leontopitheci]
MSEQAEPAAAAADAHAGVTSWNDIGVEDQKVVLKVAAERLSIVRYVFLVQIEDGIASAGQRASLEYADAVLIGWPESDSPEVVALDDAQMRVVREQMTTMEQYIARFSAMEREGDIDGMTDTLIRITERVAEARRLFQPGFPLPTFAEIRRVVQDEWDEDMGKIDPQEENTTADMVERETDEADDAARSQSAQEPAQ